MKRKLSMRSSKLEFLNGENKGTIYDTEKFLSHDLSRKISVIQLKVLSKGTISTLLFTSAKKDFNISDKA